ncbi:hypothetical protein [Rhodoferax bucti]|uniref:hypothetical protein n=1 Tax=Rhodoferax bucti TaxID=2576305 RepID=UPI001476D2D8|nr:hypothetical protein [Rhodoferax bucti]
MAGDGITNLDTDDASVVIFRASESARGVPVHQLDERLMRLIKEAHAFWARSG